eukprot:3290611-Amphidinium_carterae.1
MSFCIFFATQSTDNPSAVCLRPREMDHISTTQNKISLSLCACTNNHQVYSSRWESICYTFCAAITGRAK